MKESEVIITCSKCKRRIDKIYTKEKAEDQCPYCNAINRTIYLNIKENLEIHDQLNICSKKKGYKKPRTEIIVGDELYKKENIWVKKFRRIDRDNNSYFEDVRKKSGRVIHRCDEKLTDHLNHGSAKTQIMKQTQKQILEFCKENNLNAPTVYRMLDVLSELGEVSKELLKSSDYGNRSIEPNEELKSELGDLLFSTIVLANTLDIDLESALENVLKKYRKRLTKGSAGSEND